MSSVFHALGTGFRKFPVLIGTLYLLTPNARGAVFLSAAIAGLKGRVEVVRSGTTDWELVETGSRCRNNDKVFVHPRAFLALSYSDRSRMFFKEGARFLINSSEISEQGNAHKIVTLNEGTGFFSFRKPLNDYEGHHNRVYTRSAAFQTAEGSFLVDWDAEKSLCKVYVLSGVVRMRGINDSLPIFVKDGFWAEADSTKKLTEPRKLVQERFLSDHAWVGRAVLEKELFYGKLLRKRNSDIIEGKIQGNAIVMPFAAIKTEYKNWDISGFFTQFSAMQFAEIAFRQIVRSGDQVEDPVQHGLKHNTDRVVQGTVEEFSVSKKAVLSEMSERYEIQLEFKVRIKIEIWDPEKGEVIKADTVQGKWQQLGTGENDLEKILSQPLDEDNDIIRASVVGRGLEELRYMLMRCGINAL